MYVLKSENKDPKYGQNSFDSQILLKNYLNDHSNEIFEVDLAFCF